METKDQIKSRLSQRKKLAPLSVIHMRGIIVQVRNSTPVEVTVIYVHYFTLVDTQEPPGALQDPEQNRNRARNPVHSLELCPPSLPVVARWKSLCVKTNLRTENDLL